MSAAQANLFSPVSVGPYELANRIVMPPMTRNRADAHGVQPAMAATYYSDRADAGLIIAEGTQPSALGQGYPRTPGIHTPAQIHAWRAVTDAVHAKGGRIFLQIMHAGRISHSLNRQGQGPAMAPSAIQAFGDIYTDCAGLQPFEPPRAMTLSDIQSVLDEYRRAADNARTAGFDGVELHATSGYLPHTFLSTNTNRRDDAYGGSPEKRVRFVIETLDALIDGFGGPQFVGMRLGANMALNDIFDTAAHQTYPILARASTERELAYLSVIYPFLPGFDSGIALDPLDIVRDHYTGPIIAAGGLTKDTGTHLLATGKAQLIAFGRAFVANPDLAQRLRTGSPLNQANPDTFYTPGKVGYLDYPHLQQ